DASGEVEKMTDALGLLRARGVLADVDWHFARAIGRIGGDDGPAVLLAAALASRAVREGHVCFDLPRLLAGAALTDDAGLPVDCAWPELGEWTAALRASPLVAADRAPLVLDGADRLYLQRYWQYQTRLAAALRRRALEEEPGVDDALLADGLARLFRA